MDWPKKRNLLVLGYQDAYEAGDHVLEVIEAGPIGLEGVDDYLVAAVKKKNIQPGSTDQLPPGKGWLLAEFGGDTMEEADAKAHALMEKLRSRPNAPSMKLPEICTWSNAMSTATSARATATASAAPRAARLVTDVEVLARVVDERQPPVQP